jgi:hypothetical protein
MAKTLHRYRIWCVTENAYVYEWAETEPTDCPNNNGHTITSSLTSIVDTVSDAIAYNDLSDLNSTTTPLGASGVYTGTAENVLEYSTISVNVFSDVDASTLGLELQESNDNVNWDRIKKFDVSANNDVSHIIGVVAKWFRVKYTNGSSAQSEFRIQTLFRRFASRDQTISLQENLNDSSDGILTRSIIVGKTEGGLYNNVRLGPYNSLRTEIIDPKSAFGEIRVAEMTPIIQVSFPYNINTNIVTVGTTGGGYATTNNSLIEVGVTTSNSECSVRSTKIAKYYPGQGTMMRVAGFFDTGVTGSEQIMGWGDDEDGFYFGYNGTKFGVMRLRNSIENWEYQENFNIDKLDGAGDSGFLINPQKGNVFQVQLQWLGFGTITFSTETSSGFIFPFHRIEYPNNYTETNIRNPALPIRYVVKNTTNSTPISLHVGSATVMNEGRINVRGYGYYHTETDTNVNTTERVLFSLRNNPTFNGLTNKNSINIRFIEGANDHSQQGNVFLYINSTLSGESWVDNDTDRSIASIDTSGTISSFGRLIGGALLGKTEAKSIFLDEIVLSPGDIITMTAKESNGANGIMTGSISWIEDLL